MNRRPALYGALAGTLALTAWAALHPPEEAAPVVPAAAARGPAPGPSAGIGDGRVASPPTGRPEAPDTAAAQATSSTLREPWPEPSLQVLRAWGPPPPPPPPPPAPAPVSEPPRPPAFPYRWIGRLDDGTTPVALLAGAQRAVGVRAGDVVDGQWRVDQVLDLRLRVTWLPTGAGLTVDAR